MVWQDSRQVRSALETVFGQILQTRMQGLPFLNPALQVEAIGFQAAADGDWLGILITPWSMNLLLLPASAWPARQAGDQFERQIGYASYRFTLGHEAELGVYGQCSLFSPMLEFADHAAAVAAAQAALTGLMAPPARSVSRRDLLRGKLTKPNTA